MMMKASRSWGGMEWLVVSMQQFHLNRWSRITTAQRAANGLLLNLALALTIFFPITTWGCAMLQELSGNMEKVVVKLTYLGIQDKPIPSLLFSTHEISEALEMLKQHHLLHANDEYGISNIVITPRRLQQLVELVERQAGNVVADDSAPSVLSVALIVTGQQVCREFQWVSADAAIFFNHLHEKLSDDREAVTQFDWWRARTNL